jgi:hypothetical protein
MSGGRERLRVIFVVLCQVGLLGGASICHAVTVYTPDAAVEAHGVETNGETLSLVGARGELADGISLSEVLCIEWQALPGIPTAFPKTLLEGDQMISGRILDITGSTAVIRSLNLGTVAIPLDQVRVLGIGGMDELPDPGWKQGVWLETGELMDGRVHEVSISAIRVESPFGVTSLPWTAVRAVVFPKRPAEPTPGDQWARIDFLDGDCLRGRRLRIQGGEAFVSTAWGGDVRMAVADLRRIILSPAESRSLGDDAPLEADEQVGFGSPQPYRRDRNVKGGPLWVGGHQYAHGLGVHARSRLVFRVPPGAHWLLVRAGLDGIAGREGSAEFKVEVDGNQVYASGLVRAASGALSVRVPVSGSRQVELEVTPGPDDDAADCADWCEPEWITRPGDKMHRTEGG